MTGPQPAEVPATLAERIASAVLACPSVADLHGGQFGAVATYLPGRQVTGIRIAGDDTATDPARVGTVEVHVSGRYPFPVSEIGHEVRSAASAAMPGLAVEVTVEDYL